MLKKRNHAQNIGQQDQWTLENVRTIRDPHSHGTHAGLPHFRLDIVHQGVKVGYADLHLHHNKHGLSVGTTVCCYTRSADGTFSPARPVEE
jgi:hypothetical protein